MILPPVTLTAKIDNIRILVVIDIVYLSVKEAL
jgi:hypothetical protein